MADEDENIHVSMYMAGSCVRPTIIINALGGHYDTYVLNSVTSHKKQGIDFTVKLSTTYDCLLNVLKNYNRKKTNNGHKYIFRYLI